MIGRAAKLERLGLAEQVEPGCWTLKPGLEETLRDLRIRGDIIKTMHRVMTGAGREPDVSGFALHGDDPSDPVLGRLVQRGLHDELKGSAYAIVEGVDGRTHHLQFADLELTGDAAPGAIVEARTYEDAQGRKRLSLAIRSDLTLQQQITAPGATWLDRQLLAREPVVTGGGFGMEVRDAMDRRLEHLAGEGLARRQGQRVLFARDLLDTLRRRELNNAAGKIATETRLAYRPSAEGEHVAGYLPPADHAEFRPVRDDRRWPRLPARALASSPGTAARSPGLRRHAARRRSRLELWSKARARTLTRPVMPTRTIELCQP